MLLKAERIISKDNYLLNASDVDILKMVRHELVEKMVSDMIDKELVKVEVSEETDKQFGLIVKIRAATRVYNPDD